MNTKLLNTNHADECGRVQTIVLVLVAFLMGVAVDAFWRSSKPAGNDPVSKEFTQQAAGPAMESPKPVPVSVSISKPDPAALETVNRFIPNVKSASFEEGARVLRDAAVIEFQKTVRELQARQKKLELEFIQGQKEQSVEKQQLATKQLRELQLEQMEKLQQIAASSKAQIDAFQQLKSGGP